MQPHSLPHQLWSEYIVDESDGNDAPNRKSECGTRPSAHKKVRDSGPDDERSANRWDERREEGHRAPESRVGHAEYSEPDTGEDALDERYHQLSFHHGIDRTIETGEHCLVVPVGQRAHIDDIAREPLAVAQQIEKRQKEDKERQRGASKRRERGARMLHDPRERCLAVLIEPRCRIAERLSASCYIRIHAHGKRIE